MISSIKLNMKASSSTSGFIIEDEKIMKEFETILKSYNKEFSIYLDQILYLIHNEIGFQPWAIIAYKKEYKIFGHINSVFHKYPNIIYSNYSTPLKKIELRPTISTFFIKDKVSLSNSLFDTPLFANAWWELKDKSGDENWLYISIPPSDEWILEQETLETNIKSNLIKTIDDVKQNVIKSRIKSKKESKENGSKNKTLKVRCYSCGRETSYELFEDDGLPRLCSLCNHQISARPPEKFDDDIDIAFRDDISYKIDHPENEE